MSRLAELRALRDQITREINILERRYGRRATPTDDAQRVLQLVALRHGVSVEEILSPARARHITHARQQAAWELRQLNLSYPQIGALLGRDHTTVLFAVRKIEAARRVMGAA